MKFTTCSKGYRSTKKLEAETKSGVIKPSRTMSRADGLGFPRPISENTSRSNDIT